MEHFSKSRYDRAMLTDSTRKYLCRIVGQYDKKKTIMSFATVLCLVLGGVFGRLWEIAENGLAAGCRVFYRKIYGYFYFLISYSAGAL